MTEEMGSVRSFNTNCKIVTGPSGSGKSTIMKKLAREWSSNGRILVLCLGKKLQENLQKELQGNKVEVSTLHAIAYKVVRAFLSNRSIEMPELVSHEDGIIRGMARDIVKDVNSTLYSGERFKVNKYEIEAICNAFDSYCRKNTNDSSVVKMRVFNELEKAIRQRGIITFTLLIKDAVEYLMEPSNLQNSLCNRYSGILVDECQDLSSIEYSMIRLFSTQIDNIGFFGDPNQSIYCYRGADVDIFNSKIQQDYPSSVKTTLSNSFRYSEQIATLSSRLLSLPCPIHSERTEKTDFLLCEPSIINIKKLAQRHGETVFLAREHIGIIEAELLLRLADRGYSISAKRSLADYKPLSLLIGMMCAANPNSFEELPFKVQKQVISAFCFFPYLTVHKEIADSMLRKMPYEAFNMFMKFENGNALGDLPLVLKLINKSETPLKVRDVIKTAIKTKTYKALCSNDRFDVVSGKSLAPLCYLLEELTIGEAVNILTQKSKVNKFVNVMSIHSAKGLAVDHVVVTGLYDGMFPLFGANLDEEKRILNVAITRASQSICLLANSQSSIKKSEFINDLLLCSKNKSVSKPTCRS